MTPPPTEAEAILHSPSRRRTPGALVARCHGLVCAVAFGAPARTPSAGTMTSRDPLCTSSPRRHPRCPDRHRLREVTPCSCSGGRMGCACRRRVNVPGMLGCTTPADRARRRSCTPLPQSRAATARTSRGSQRRARRRRASARGGGPPLPGVHKWRPVRRARAWSMRRVGPKDRRGDPRGSNAPGGRGFQFLPDAADSVALAPANLLLEHLHGRGKTTARNRALTPGDRAHESSRETVESANAIVPASCSTAAASSSRRTRLATVPAGTPSSAAHSSRERGPRRAAA